MKTKITFILTLLIGAICFAQNGINYKAIIKDGAGNIVANDIIIIQFSILEDATTVYSETHSPTTDSNGVVIITIGEGSPISGVFTDIDWSSMNHSLNVMVNLGSGLQDMGTTPFKSVPYALKSADAVFTGSGDNAYKELGNIGIGVTNPAARLHIEDEEDATILLQTNTISDVSSLRLENGNAGGSHSFFKIENRSDFLRIGTDSDLTAGTGYADVTTISTTGNITTQGSLRLAFGNAITEFSTDEALSGNSNSAVPTEFAVKSYVDGFISTPTEKTILISATSFTGNQSNESINYKNYGVSAQYTASNGSLLAPLILPIGSTVTSMTFYFRDGTSSTDVNLEGAVLACYSTSTFASVLFTVNTYGGSTSGQTLNYDTPFTIINDYQYSIRIRPTSTWGTSDFGICSVKVTYTN